MTNSSRNPQLNNEGELHHLLAIEGLPRAVVERILNTADSFINIAEREVKKRAAAARQERIQSVL